jgi:maternal embryonic leucine zipper kinase
MSRAKDPRFPVELTSQFTIKDTIGAGGFAKVKVARHKLTNEKVAIKIMDKAALRETDDLERVSLEIAALKSLNHQNISRLYMVHETETTFYLVLEYAVGGELFDYIVARERCKEEEARGFFRQIVSAVAFCHSKGIAHRDLKPENLLLDSRSGIKLIDFGLIARPKNIDSDLLSTCCGSAAYAAPELIRGEKYKGQPADMWSLGILLYALLCGFLPFDDDNTQRLYRLIQRGTYEIPPWLSVDSQKLIGQLLKHNPDHRLTMKMLLSHPWLLKGLKTKAIDHGSTLGDLDELNMDVVTELAAFHAVTPDVMADRIKSWQYDALTCNYELLNRLHAKGKPLRLPKDRWAMEPEKAAHLVRSGKKSSLALNTDATGLAGAKLSAKDKSRSLDPEMQRKMMAMRAIDPKGSKGNVTVPISDQIRASSVGGRVNEVGQPLDSRRSKGQPGVSSDDSKLHPGKKNQEVYGSANASLHVAGVRERDTRKGSVRSLFGSIGSLFGSRDNLTTPRKVKALFNVKTTSTKEPDFVLQQLEEMLEANQYEVKKKGFLLKAKRLDRSTKKYTMAINFEVCIIDKVDLTGIRLVRVKGETFAYKKETDRLLKQIQHAL